MYNQGHLGDLRLRTAPTWEPIAVADLKLQLRIASAFTTEDVYLASIITAARKLVEKYTRLTIPQAAWSVWHDRWPGVPLGWWDGVRDGALIAERRAFLEIPVPPVQAITAVKVYNDADEVVVVPSATYFVSLGSESTPARLTLRTNASWPVALRCADAIEIQFTAGFTGTDASTNSVPEGLKAAIKMVAAWLYVNRGDFDESILLAKSGAGAILEAYKVPLL